MKGAPKINAHPLPLITVAALITAERLTKTYPRTGPGASGHAVVVDAVSFSLERGATLGLVGESGSGKSTIARMVLGLVPPTSGQVLFDGVPVHTLRGSALRAFRRRVQPVFQDPYAALNPRMRIREILAEPYVIHRHEAARSRAALRAATAQLLSTVGLDGSALDRYPHEFSGGQRQRINIARALALRPEVLVLDEPVSALDVSVGAQVVNLLRSLQREYALTYLFITHSMPLVRYLATEIAVLRGGRLVETGPAAQLLAAPAEAYTRSLIAATPELAAQPATAG